MARQVATPDSVDRSCFAGRGAEGAARRGLGRGTQPWPHGVAHGTTLSPRRELARASRRISARSPAIPRCEDFVDPLFWRMSGMRRSWPANWLLCAGNAELLGAEHHHGHDQEHHQLAEAQPEHVCNLARAWYGERVWPFRRSPPTRSVAPSAPAGRAARSSRPFTGASPSLRRGVRESLDAVRRAATSHSRAEDAPAQRARPLREAGLARTTATSSRRSHPLERTGRFSACVARSRCALACAFCATGRLGLSRNLESWEIVEQVRLVRAHSTAVNASRRRLQGMASRCRTSNACSRPSGS